MSLQVIQEAQLSQRGRAMPRVVEYFRQSLKAALSRRINMVTFANLVSVRLPSLKFVGLRVLPPSHRRRGATTVFGQNRHHRECSFP